ncbi:methyl-accepting chemotaxis protein [Paenibacillus turpanensis]|uniref:methyl-accepting chemotaxis protein n=1 Tax=Paenibacillus turpanensis TaxID=2689078 RepID=UPI00140AC946|nr:HAMP domain-containing methyl-accepting chemotaxis protein [Paenibacillus turpanensis]
MLKKIKLQMKKSNVDRQRISGGIRNTRAFAEKVLKPISMVLDRFKYWQKFGFVTVLFLIPLVLVTSFLVNDLNGVIRTTKAEKEGVQAVIPLKTLLTHVQQHRGLLSGVLNGDSSLREAALKKQEEIDADLAAVAAVHDRFGKQWGSQERWEAINRQWSELKTTALSMQSFQSFEGHTKLISDILKLMSFIADNSSLTLDPQADTYKLMDMTVHTIPELSEAIGQIRGRGTGAAATKTVSTEDREQLLTLRKLSDEKLKDLQYVSEMLGQENPELKPMLQEQMTKVSESFLIYFRELENNFLVSSSVSTKPDVFFQAGTKLLDTLFGMHDVLTQELNHKLEQRISKDAWARNLILLVVVVVTLAVYVVFAALYQSIRQAVGELNRVSASLAAGDLTARYELTSKDEMNDAGLSFNRVADEFHRVVAMSRQQTEEIAESAGRQQEISSEASQGVAEVVQAVRQIAAGASQQLRSTEEMSRAMDEMASGLMRVTENASVSAEAAAEASQQAEEGSIKVRTAVGQMETIRAKMSGVSGSVQELAEVSAQVASAMGVITDIAAQTQLLSLNASIEAARAGEHGRGFAVVASEVQKLAVSCSASAKSILERVEQLRRSAASAITETEQGNAEIDKGNRMIHEAGTAFESIVAAVQRVSQQMQEVSAASEEMSAGSQQVSASAAETVSAAETADKLSQRAAQISEAQLKAMKELAESGQRLGRLSAEMEEAVKLYKL